MLTWISADPGGRCSFLIGGIASVLALTVTIEASAEGSGRRSRSSGGTTQQGAFHETRGAAGYAASLVAKGSPQDLAQAEKVLDAVLGCQELHEKNPHYGNFKWMMEDAVVEDLNAVEFVLENLIPMMIQHGDRLSPAVRKRVLDAIRLGLDEIRRLDVLVAYSNITSLDILNTSLGGELLKDPEIARRGYDKLVAWMAFTDLSGIPFEYNSPTYTAVTIRALKLLCDHVRDEATRVRARTMAARLGLSVALHIHRGTGRWAGPHSRAYHPTVICRTGPEVEMVRRWIADGTLPAWVDDVLDSYPVPMTVVESADSVRGTGIITHQSRSFAVGVVSKAGAGLGEQANVFMVHYNRPGAERPGVLYARYLLNDKWLGDYYHPTDRSRTRNLIDEGRFFGVQEGTRIIGVYAPPPMQYPWSSAKTALIWTRRDRVDEIWIGDQRVETLPATVAPGQVVVVGSGETLMAIRPLSVTDLGHDSPIRLVEIDGDLVMEMCNYRGPDKTFWELVWPGPFYRGQPRCAFYIEVAERSDHPSGKAFGEIVGKGQVVDEARPSFVYTGEGQRPWKAEYSRDGRSLGLEVDLMEWKLLRRWTHEGGLDWPMLESPMARQTRDGRVVVGDAVLTCGKAAAWLYANPKTKRWVAGYHGPQPAPLTLTLPAGKVGIQSMGTGTIVVEGGIVTVEAVGQPARQFPLPPP